MERLNLWTNGLLAGFLISIGGAVYLSCENRLAGAILFALGLFTICTYGFNLFTGKVGYLFSNPPVYTGKVLIIWLCNFIGCALFGLLFRFASPEAAERAVTMTEAKLTQQPSRTLALGFFCGILMYIAVDNFRQNPHPFGKCIGIFTCVPAFILCGFEHCVADMFYFAAAGAGTLFSLSTILFLLLVTLGNTAGGLLIPLVLKLGFLREAK